MHILESLGFMWVAGMYAFCMDSVLGLYKQVPYETVIFFSVTDIQHTCRKKSVECYLATTWVFPT